MAQRLIVCVSPHQVLFDKREAYHKNKDLKDNIWQSISRCQAALSSQRLEYLA